MGKLEQYEVMKVRVSRPIDCLSIGGGSGPCRAAGLRAGLAAPGEAPHAHMHACRRLSLRALAPPVPLAFAPLLPPVCAGRSGPRRTDARVCHSQRSAPPPCGSDGAQAVWGDEARLRQLVVALTPVRMPACARACARGAQLLGKGSFGSVYCVRRLNDRSLHVMKKISIHNMPQKERVATEQECKVLQRLRHPGIVCYEDSFIHKNRQLCIVMSFCEGGDLSTVIEKRKMRLFPEQDVISWFLQIALALQYMHDEHILHRDLKTQNIFLTKQGIIKLGDFGIAKVLEGTLEMAKTVIGTPYYMSPELFRNQPYSYKSDIWSLGCVLYELVGLRHAFEARDMNSLVQKILRGNYAPIPSTASKDLRGLIKSMLGLSPSSRPTVNDVLALPFIRKEMGNYIQNQLGDDSAASLLKEDPQLVRFIQQEQSHLEQQARKLGFDVKKRPAHDDDAYQAPRESVPPSAPAHAKPSNLSMPTAQEVEKDKVAVELREKERQKRAQAFLERELRAKERAEQALKQLQKEKQERLRALQEQREMRQKRMSNVHPRGEAGLMNDWQKRLQQAQMQHEERRRQMGMVPGDHRCLALLATPFPRLATLFPRLATRPGRPPKPRVFGVSFSGGLMKLLEHQKPRTVCQHNPGK